MLNSFDINPLTTKLHLRELERAKQPSLRSLPSPSRVGTNRRLLLKLGEVLARIRRHIAMRVARLGS